MRFAVILMLSLLASGCATQVPKAVQETPASQVTAAEARTGNAPLGSTIRWGGTIASTENRQSETWVEIVARELERRGRPRETDRSSGRFLARFPGFLEPTEYSTGREITVVGVLEKSLTRTIGEFPYTFPVVSVTEHYLWPPRPEPRYSGYPVDPFWYDPWYPWGWGYYPFRYRPYHYPYFP